MEMMGNKNYEVIIDTINDIFHKLYSLMNEYLEYIFNAPSTINRIMKYYAIGFDDNEPTKRYIMFGGTIVREYELIIPEYEGVR